MHITKSYFSFVTGFFVDQSIYFNHATYSIDKKKNNKNYFYAQVFINFIVNSYDKD